jgi:hypothetical protein
MWGRVVEIMIAVWLSFSPFLFGHFPAIRPLWMSDLICAGAMLLFSSVSFYEPLRRVHLLNILIAGWLIGLGYVYGGYPAAAGYQNNIFTGLTVLLMAIIPNHANQPPRDWQRFYRKVAANLVS